MEDVIINKVAQSGIVVLDIENYFPSEETVLFDLRDYLIMGLILKEKEYREALKIADWKKFEGKNVAIICSADAIVPLWAYMLAVTYLQDVATNMVFGDETELIQTLLIQNLRKIDIKEFEGKRVVVKGCGDKKIPEAAYVEITKILHPVAKSIMYGEPCSTVPVFKRK